ncbi:MULTISPECIES: septum formation inhibitor Maf [unclassified Nitratiruptor]|uniref:septum formation inhibitor Maf n=1 Tax=unclassified Nitratiruptor TaxID=2624044 RepID=UPI001914E5EB|nr:MULTISPECIES: septum formation inhibitor Maf [unclassified Nitratiruptor]BCD60828.1 septum formation protein [Nitratiruptor sp. YY08-10]BCD64760.1 septum formation protein [Nitratiruptor sp. YY08-14]
MIRLASGSETRAKLLQNAGIDFIQSPIDFDEEKLLKQYKKPKDFVCAAARGKMEAAVQKYGLDIPIVVADTVVAVGDEILRKAKNEKEAKEILQKQSGNKVDIITCMIYKDKEKTVEDLDITSYIFAPFDDKDLQNYLQSGDWRGKAGACMVEGFCKKYIKEVRGRESTAMGLQVERLAEIAKDL